VSEAFFLFKKVLKGCEPYPDFYSMVLAYFPRIIDRAEVKNKWSYTSVSLYTRMACTGTTSLSHEFLAVLK